MVDANPRQPLAHRLHLLERRMAEQMRLMDKVLLLVEKSLQETHAAIETMQLIHKEENGTDQRE